MRVTDTEYRKNFNKIYEESINNSISFWEDQSQFLFWDKKFTSVLSGELKLGNVRWFEGGKLNACYNCLDRHLEKHADKLAIIWEGEGSNRVRKIKYSDLHKSVCKFANLLKSNGIKKGDVVCLYLPMIPEAVMAMLACARIGAVHSVIFGGFSAESIKSRILNSNSSAVITADGSQRNGKLFDFKSNIDKALIDCPNVKTVINIKNYGNNINWFSHRDIDYFESIKNMTDECPCEPMDSNDPLFILYTSGSTGKPKGIVHSVAGYLLYASFTHKFTFNIQPNSVYWCTADIGWITGHSYIVYGPLANATSVVIFEGNSLYPDSSTCFDLIDKYNIDVFYTSPTFIRYLIKEDNKKIQNNSFKSLRVLGSVGEPISPESWKWYSSNIGLNNCPIMDTWWQTETGGFMISPPLDMKLQKPGMAQRPAVGISLNLLDDNGNEIMGEGSGTLVVSKPWPGMMLGIYKNHERFLDVYLRKYPGYYFTGDGAKRDSDGDYCLTGRIDDTINVSGHLLSTAEIESAISLHPKAVEAAVVGFKHQMKGKGICAFITLSKEVLDNEIEDVKSEIKALVRKELGPIVSLDIINFTDSLPKTRSGKIMRRILRKIANNDIEDLGDISTLSNPGCIDILIDEFSNQKN